MVRQKRVKQKEGASNITLMIVANFSSPDSARGGPGGPEASFGSRPVRKCKRAAQEGSPAHTRTLNAILANANKS